MTFNSLLFAAFLGVVFPVYLLLRRHVTARNSFLLLSSYVFYAAWDVRFLGLIVLSTLTDYLVARALDRPRGRRKLLLSISIALNLGLLVTFKYLGFFSESLQGLAGSLGWHLDTPTVELLLPVGISFYTFQTLGYTIDVYRRQVPAERSLLTFALFVAFFPQLVAGPIERARRLLPQLNAVRPFDRDQLYRGFFLIWWGLFKKVVIADNVARVVDVVFGSGAPTGLDVLVGSYAFAIQIYCDFSGYTDIARGVAKCLGVELTPNFRQPYLAEGPQAFWRRWHISLSTWFRDYLYIPLGGARHGRARTARNVLIVFLLAGLWHGAALTFALWGLLHGLWLCLAQLAPKAATARGRWRQALAVLLTFHGICLLWILFRAESIQQAGVLFGRLGAGGVSVLDAHLWRLFLVCASCLLTASTWRRLKGRPDWAFALPMPLRAALYLVLWFGIVLFGVTEGSEFIYFQF